MKQCIKLMKRGHLLSFLVGNELMVSSLTTQLSVTLIHYLTMLAHQPIIKSPQRSKIRSLLRSQVTVVANVDGVIIASACELMKIDCCHALLNQQLCSLDHTSVDVAVDGNCFFRATFYSLYNNERTHDSLRALAAERLRQIVF